VALDLVREVRDLLPDALRVEPRYREQAAGGGEAKPAEIPPVGPLLAKADADHGAPRSRSRPSSSSRTRSAKAA